MMTSGDRAKHAEAKVTELLQRIRDLEAQLASARDSALEEAARVADECSPCSPGCGRPDTIAETIRFSLRSQPAARRYSMEELEAAVMSADSEVFHTGTLPTKKWMRLFRVALEGKTP